MNITPKSKTVKLAKLISCIRELFWSNQEQNTAIKKIAILYALVIHNNFDLCLSACSCLMCKVL